MHANRIEEIKNKLEKREDKIIHNFISVELINLMNKYNNLLKRKNTHKSNMPYEEILIFLDGMYNLIDYNGFLIDEKFDNFREKTLKETKKTYKKLKNITSDWVDLYKRYNFLITLFKKEEARFLFIDQLSKLITEDLKNQDIQQKYLSDFNHIPKFIIDNPKIQETFKTFNN